MCFLYFPNLDICDVHFLFKKMIPIAHNKQLISSVYTSSK